MLMPTIAASDSLEPPWILPRQGLRRALVAMVQAKFGSNKHEVNEWRAEEEAWGELCGGSGEGGMFMWLTYITLHFNKNIN